jgi:hypothetical protein
MWSGCRVPATGGRTDPPHHEGERLLGEARPAFRDYAKGVEGRRLGAGRRERAAAPDGLRDAVNAELDARG